MSTDEPLRLLAVDDEPAARDDLVHLLSATPGVGAVSSAGSAEDALKALDTTPRLHGVFLDVLMPGLDGIELGRVLQRLQCPPAVVFVSAHDRFAADAFSVAALDYLLKPVARDRLRDAVRRIAATVGCDTRHPQAPPDADVVFVDALTGGAVRLLPRESIVYLKSRGDYVRVVANDGQFLLSASLAELAGRWASHGFVRVHRGFVVNLHRAVAIKPLPNGTSVMLMQDGSAVPIARRQLSVLRRRLSL